MTKLPVTLLVLCGASAVAFADGTLSGRVLDLNDQPVGGASVVVTGADGVETRVVTDPTGRYVATVHTPGPYSVAFAFGRMRSGARVDVPTDGTVTVDGRLSLGGEIIEVQGEHLPMQYAKPKVDPLRIPPYSDRAVLGDHWSKAWLLLDVDDRGLVTRVKFLKRAGHDLDPIAVKYAFGMTFDPARNKHGVPTQSFIVWPLEWPSVEWMQTRQLSLTRLPSLLDAVQTQYGIAFDSYPPCAEGEGINLSLIHATQRDCSVPDLSTADASEPWLTRDSGVPAPVVAAAPVLDPVTERADRIASARRNRTYAILAAVTTGAAVTGLLVSYGQFKKYSDRKEADFGVAFPMPGRLASDEHHKNSWELGMIGFAAGTMLSGIATGYFWSHASAFQVEARSSGGALSYAGSF